MRHPSSNAPLRDDRKTKAQLLKEVRDLRARLAELEATGGMDQGPDMAGTDHESLMRELRHGMQRYRLLAEYSGDLIWTIDTSMRTTYVSPAITRMLGYTSEEAMAMPLNERFAPESMQQMRDEFTRLLAKEQAGQLGDESSTLRLRERHKDGHYVWIESVARPMRDQSGAFLGFVGASRDISRRVEVEQKLIRLNEELEQRVEQRTRELEAEVATRKRSEQALRESEERYRTVADHTHDWESWVGPDGAARYVSPACERISGYPPETFLKNFSFLESIMCPEDLPGWRLYMADISRMDQGPMDFRITRLDGETRWICQVSRPVTDENGVSLGVRTSMRDITERKIMEQRLQHDALHDPLTGLANRTLCLDRITLAMERANRRERYFFAVVFLDLDRFKMVNDSFGHTFGDRLLREAANRLSGCVRELDTVSRFGGDEFILLLEELRSPREAIRTVQRMREKLGEPCSIEDHDLAISASFGIFLSPTLSERAEDLLQYANIAMHRAKDAGRNRIKVFSSRMLEQAVLQMALETDLRRAVANQEFFIHFQPIVSLSNARLTGFEALVRWHHPVRGDLSPAEFIPASEETGLIIELGQWVLHTACRTMAVWREAFPQAKDLILSVNLSARQFSQPDLLEQVRRTLRETKYPADKLRLEITETTIMENADMAAEKLAKLRNLGIKLSIDDFGTGYSSMNYLHRFPLDTLKIDLSFVKRMHASSEDMEIIKAIVNLAHNLGMEVVAEGVEQAAQQVDLQGLNCEYGQGYLFSRPVTPENAARYIEGVDGPVAPEPGCKISLDGLDKDEGEGEAN